uniref:TerB family tellurite resistance protein n=1 Tax=uncultured marine group II/III euryarchaeote KM3_18_D06 TaxID=1457956 RepID=A0A075GPY0_9EURY|nr:hypothetical protein [uncultured marine group II/III euryarchaeote KM3_18_D06]
MGVQGRLGDFTVEQRVLLHLSDHPLQRSEWEGKQEQTQAGISEAVGVARKHLPRTLKRLLSAGRVEQETRHVPGARQRCRVYGLTASGIEAANPLRSSIVDRAVLTEGGETTIGAIAGHEIPLLIVLSKIDRTGRYDPELGEVDRPEEEDGGTLYRKILHRAWNDGKLTSTERNMLDDLSMHLGIEPDRSDEIEKAVMAEREDSNEEHIPIFVEVLECAWLDGEISEDEQAMLDSLALALGLDKAKAKTVQTNWIADNS